MYKRSTQHSTRTVFTLLALVFTFGAFSIQANQSSQIPAFLPMANDVPMAESLPIDGEWKINQIGKRIRIKGGRAYALDPWVHLFVLEVQPNMVVSKEWVRTSRGQYSGQDLPLVGPFTAKLLPNGTMSMAIQGMFGQVNLTLSPLNIDDKRGFQGEISDQDSIAPPAEIPPTVVYGFDGTNQDAGVLRKTNVWHFLKAHRSSHQAVQNIYAPGVGTEHASTDGFYKIRGAWFGLGGRQIINAMYEQLIKNFEKGHTGIVLVGFSRGAALAREFANVINERGDPIMYKKLNRPYGRPPKITYMGLFDTVYSFGIPFNKGDLNYRRAIPDNVMAVAHATAELEKRNTFDLWSIHSSKIEASDESGSRETGSIEKGNYRIELAFDAGHDDVGGAQENNYHGYDPLIWVLEQAQNAGVLLVIPEEDAYLRFPGEEVVAKGDGLGKRQIYYPERLKKVPAIYHKDAKDQCEGEQVYLSGSKCYQCPDDYKRYSFTRKMTHPEACTERGFGFDKTKVPATYVWEANGCPIGQFKYQGICLSCPEGTKRDHIAGIDSGQCKVE